MYGFLYALRRTESYRIAPLVEEDGVVATEVVRRSRGMNRKDATKPWASSWSSDTNWMYIRSPVDVTVLLL